MIEFVCFHQDRGIAPSLTGVEVRISQWCRMIDTMFRSARIWHPGATFTILSDSSTAIAGVSVPHTIDRLDQQSVPVLMLRRARHHLNYLRRRDWSRPAVLVDSDFLWFAPCSAAFADTHDLALAERSHGTMPFNGGLLLVGNRRPDVVIEWFEGYLARYERDYAGPGREWYADQYALRDAVRASGRCVVKSLPDSTWNWTPPSHYAGIRNGGKIAMHFKGHPVRKSWIQAVWDARLAPLERDAQRRARGATAPPTAG